MPSLCSTAEDISQVIRYALSQQGRPYDVKHIIRRPFFYAFPWELFPAGVKRTVTEFTLSESDTICSRALSEAFQSVGYPIRPLWVNPKTADLPATEPPPFSADCVTAVAVPDGYSLAENEAVRSTGDTRYLEVRLKGTRYITPADYDLSRFLL